MNKNKHAIFNNFLLQNFNFNLICNLKRLPQFNYCNLKENKNNIK